MIHKIGPFIGADSNIYLLTGDRNVLIDTGTGLTTSYVINAIKQIIGDTGTIDIILLTHCHFDHIGGAPAIMNAFGCKTYIGAKDAPAVREGDSLFTLANDFGVDIPPYPVEDLTDGDIIDLGDHKLRVIDTPGHTQGGICFYDEISSSLFSGDTVFEDGVGRTDFNGGSIKLLRNSIKYLIDMPIKGLYPGHGSMATDGHAAVVRGMEIVGD